MPDISSELDTIQNDVKGANVKQAIYNALVKVNDAKVPKPEPRGPVIGTALVVANGGMHYTIGTAIYGSLWNYVQETSDSDKTTSTLTIVAVKYALLVATAMHRGAISISGDGWTHLIDSAAIDPTDRNQRITVWTKTVQAGSYPVTFTLESQNRMTAKLICLYGANSLSVIDNTTIATVPFTPSAKNGKRRLYLLSSAYASSSSNPPNAITSSYDLSLDLRAAEELRFSVFYDYQPSVNVVPSFSYYDPSDFEVNFMNALTLDINEEV